MPGRGQTCGPLRAGALVPRVLAPLAEQKGLNKSTMTTLAVFPGWSSCSLVTGTGELFIFIALLINVEYSQGFLFLVSFFLSALLFGKVTER